MSQHFPGGDLHITRKCPVKIKISFYCHVTLCSPVEIYQNFGWLFCPHMQCGRVTSTAHSNEKLVTLHVFIVSVMRTLKSYLVWVVGVLAKIKPCVFKWKSRSATSWYILPDSISVKCKCRLWSVFLYLIWFVRDYWQIGVK